jgi:O-antigen/teichoic acid export membrane protein
VSKVRTLVRRISSNEEAAKLWQHASMLLGNTALASVLGAAFWVLSARLYPASAVGIASSLAALVPLVGIVASLGAPELAIRFLHETSAQRSMVHRLFAATAATGTLAALGWVVFAYDRNPIAALHGLPTLMAVVCMTAAFAVGTVSTALLIAGQRPGWVLAETAVGGVVRLVACALAAPYGAAGLFTATAIATCTTSVVSIVVVYAKTSLRTGGHWVPDRDARTYAASNWASTAVAAAPRALVGVIVLAALGADAAAWIAVPFTLLQFLTLIPSLVSRVVFAQASRTPARLSSLLRTGVIGMACATIPVAAVTALLATHVLAVFGSEYAANAAAMFRWLCLAAVCSIPNYAIDTVLAVRKDKAGYFAVNVVGAVGVITAVLCIAPHSVAAVGIAWVVGQLWYTTVGLLVLYRPRRR